MSDYPSADRQSNSFAIRYIRWLIDSGTVNEIGPDAFAVLVGVVTLEDELHYQRPPNFFNEQLMRRCGIASEPALIRARKRAVEAELLIYSVGAKRRPGTYFVSGFPNESLAKAKGKRRESETNPLPSIPNTQYLIPNTSLFDSWYEVYIRKDARGKAESAYPKAISDISKTEKVNAAQAAQLLMQWTIERMPLLAKAERKFQPLPASWLNAKRYRDEIPGQRLTKQLAREIPPHELERARIRSQNAAEAKAS